MGDSYVAIDAYSFLGEGYNKKKLEEYHKKLSKWCYWKRAQFLYNYFTSETRAIILCLIVIGIVTGLIATFVEFSVRGLIAAKKEIAAMVGYFIASQAIWVLSCVLLALCACTAPKFISPFANGSGIPEMKTIMSGVDMPQYLSGKTLVAKVIGLILAQGSELIIGRVGPFVHIGACACNQILKLPFFKALRDNYHLKMQMIAAAASLGPAAVFGAPIGGVFFSIEVTATFFYAKNLWKGILCAGCAKVVNAYFRGVLHGGIFSPFFKTDFPARPYSQTEFFLLILAGTLVSFVGAFFTFAVKRYVMLRGKFPRWKTSIWIQVGVVTFLVAAVQYPITLIGFGKYDSIEILLSVNELQSGSVVLSKGYEIGYLIGIFCIKFAIVVISTTLPLPAGMFAPSVLLGCYCGRMFGELFALLLPGMGIQAGGYALIGMAAFPCAVTGTFSPALIILEATGAMAYLPELLLVSVIGYSIGEAMSGSIYNVMIKIRKLPFLSANLTPKYTGRLVQEIMETNVQYCSFKSTSADLAMLLEDAPNEQTFAIVDSKETMHLMGSVTRTQLEDMLSTWPESVKSPKPVRWVYRYQTSKHALSQVKEFYGAEGRDIKPGELQVTEDVDAFDKFVQKGLERGCCGFVFNTETKKLERKKSPIEQKIDQVEITDASAPPVVTLEEISIGGSDENQSGITEFSLGDSETPKVEKSEPEDLEKQPHIEFNPAPFQTFAHTPLVKVQFLFSMLTLQQAYITYNGRLVGRLTKRKLLEYTPPVK